MFLIYKKAIKFDESNLNLVDLKLIKTSFLIKRKKYQQQQNLIRKFIF